MVSTNFSLLLFIRVQGVIKDIIMLILDETKKIGIIVMIILLLKWMQMTF